jgi:hypothetical protein
MHTAVNRAIRVGRATALAIGVGVVLAVVLGFATVALAAVPGDPFKLGKVNIINNATTTLTGGAPDGGAMLDLRRGSGKGPVLNIENTNPASNSRGVNIQVANGQAPITVVPGAGKASNLNADQLDGKSEEDFLSASRVYRVGTPVPVQGQDGNGKSVFLTALDGLVCDDGDVAIGGGGNAVDIEDDLNAVVPSDSDAYQIEFQDNRAPSKFAGFVMCSDSSRPFK